MLEVATILAGPAVGFFFAELGADVIKIENPRTGGDPTRGWKLAGEAAEDGRCAYFCSVNFGKRSITLDLKDSSQRGVFLELLADTDVLLMNYRPGVAERLELGFESLLERFPRLIIGWVTGYGPEQSRPGFDVLIQAESGFLAMNGPPGGPPCRLPVAMIDLVTAHQLKEGLLLALLERERSGRGQLVEVSLWKSALATLVNQASNVLMAGYDPVPEGTEHPNLFPYGTLLPCQDGPVFVAVGTDGQFASLCEALGDPELARHYSKNEERTLHRETIRPQLFRLAGEMKSDHLLNRLLETGVPAGLVRSVQQALQSPEALELMLAQGGLKALRSVAFQPGLHLRPPPRLGEHNHEILPP